MEMRERSSCTNLAAIPASHVGAPASASSDVKRVRRNEESPQMDSLIAGWTGELGNFGTNINMRLCIACFLISLMYAPSMVAHADDPNAVSSLNEKVLEFARSKMGEVVGDGECTSLVHAAYRSAGAKRFRRSDRDQDLVWGERLESLQDARPGDVLQFRDAVFKGRKTYRNGTYKYWEYKYPQHTAIVANAKKTRAGLVITVLHQNVINGTPDKEGSRPVRMDRLNMSELQPGGQVVAYRPVSQ
jgi:hypothetical protein